MSAILALLRDHELRRFETGEIIVQQGQKTARLYFLGEGAVEILKDEVTIAAASVPGVVFGEMAALLNVPHTATVRAVKPCSFYVVENARAFLEATPAMSLHLCELLAGRLDSLNKYLVDVKQQFAGHDHLGMVDEVLEALLHRQPRNRVRPKESTIRQGELPN
jgi:CRP/FNR family transcriptional regulator, cyclic AMP receptor protein